MGKYEVTGKLGEGGMAVVYRGIQECFKRPVAIKCLRPELAASSTEKVRFMREGRTAALLKHPNIVVVYDAGEEGEALVLVMELLEGRTLANILYNPKDKTALSISIERTLHVMSQVCDAVMTLHETGHAHRDLKPENIFLIEHGDDQDFVKVMDFGIAKDVVIRDETDLTALGRPIGTPRYMPPEQWAGNADRRTDIFALGVIAFRMLAGTFPFAGQTQTEIFTNIHLSPPRSLRTFCSNAPQELEEVIEKSLAKSPEDRFQTVREFASALKESVRQPPSSSASKAKKSESTPQPPGEPSNLHQSFANGPQSLSRLSRARQLVTLPLAIIGVLAVFIIGVNRACVHSGTTAQSKPESMISVFDVYERPLPDSATGDISRAMHLPGDVPAVPTDVEPASISSEVPCVGNWLTAWNGAGSLRLGLTNTVSQCGFIQENFSDVNCRGFLRNCRVSGASISATCSWNCNGFPPDRSRISLVCLGEALNGHFISRNGGRRASFHLRRLETQ